MHAMSRCSRPTSLCCAGKKRQFVESSSLQLPHLMAPSRWTSFLGGGSKEGESSEPLVPDSNAPDSQQNSYSACVSLFAWFQIFKIIINKKLLFLPRGTGQGAFSDKLQLKAATILESPDLSKSQSTAPRQPGRQNLPKLIRPPQA